jgi:hypothetical protein
LRSKLATAHLGELSKTKETKPFKYEQVQEALPGRQIFLIPRR